jgi:hypothetical protein
MNFLQFASEVAVAVAAPAMEKLLSLNFEDPELEI